MRSSSFLVLLVAASNNTTTMMSSLAFLLGRRTTTSSSPFVVVSGNSVDDALALAAVVVAGGGGRGGHRASSSSSSSSSSSRCGYSGYGSSSCLHRRRHPPPRPSSRCVITRTRTTQSLSSLSSSSSTAADVAPPLPYVDHAHNSIRVTIPAVAVVAPSSLPNDDPDHRDDDLDLDDDHHHPYRDPAAFLSGLRATISTASALGKSAIWLNLPMCRGRLLEAAHEAGMTFHHAYGDAATLCLWLKDDVVSSIPEYATHQVGVGAVVIRKKRSARSYSSCVEGEEEEQDDDNDDLDELLVVREARNNYRPWKIPGGLAELGEHLDEAAIREVYEETGIQCRFVGVLGVRHSHGVQFGRSDLYFVCRLEPIIPSSEDDDDEGGCGGGEKKIISEPIPQAGEIEDARWLPLSEFRDMVNSDDVNVGHPMMATIMKVVDQRSGGKGGGMMERVIIPSIVPRRKPSPLYHVPIRPDDPSPTS